MRSWKFPSMLNTNNSKIWRGDEYNQATTQNAITLLKVGRGELQCDPWFGLTLKDYFFNQNSYVLKDMIIDVIYAQVATFLPQVKVERRDIDIVQDRAKGTLYCQFKGINQIDYKLNTYSLLLFDGSELK